MAVAMEIEVQYPENFFKNQADRQITDRQVKKLKYGTGKTMQNKYKKEITFFRTTSTGPMPEIQMNYFVKRKDQIKLI